MRVRRQELNKLVDKCCAYNHGRGELLNNIPNSGRDISISNVSSSIRESRPLLSKLLSSKQPNAPKCSVVSKHLKQSLSSIQSKKNKRPAIRGRIGRKLGLGVKELFEWSDELELICSI
ncbi:hypothetical protein KY289_028598 [Solanum tuberosum]|nr:hypothetical protein KY289_028598 [Solanum tuberosum]